MKNIIHFPFISHVFLRALAIIAMLGVTARADAATPPKPGDEAPRFNLKTLDNQSIDLAQIAAGKTTVLVILRGWPGYQCPFCTVQVYEYVQHAADFAARNVPVVMVYPGPAEQLRAHAKEFLENKNWPQNFHFVLDPDYGFIGTYGLRWDQKGETAYPSTFVIDEKGRVRFAQVSHEHGDRVGAATLLRMLGGVK